MDKNGEEKMRNRKSSC